MDMCQAILVTPKITKTRLETTRARPEAAMVRPKTVDALIC